MAERASKPRRGAQKDAAAGAVKPQAAANTMWGGRFDSGPHALLDAINTSIDFDRRLAKQDLAGSRAHCQMLSACGIITADEAACILTGLDQIAAEINAGTFPYARELEDIHMNIEARLRYHSGAVAGKLHTARSRNDQVATDLRLFIRDAIDGLQGRLLSLQHVLLDHAERYAATVMPGFTHLQIAQPMTFGFYCLAHEAAFDRDRGRFADARVRLNYNPLGSAALAGTSYPIDRMMTAQLLGFTGPMANALDGVSDRDFAVETLAAASLTALHLSRLAEEIVLWSSPLFGFIRVSERFSTGSSIMPQKRNPDAAELIRGKTGRILGSFQALCVVLKGLPLGYGKDMQEDKEPVFDALDNLDLCLATMREMMAEITVCEAVMAQAASRGFAAATDLADWMVQQWGIAFRDAHHCVGQLVGAAERLGVGLEALPRDVVASIEPRLVDETMAIPDAQRSVAMRTSYGGTAPDEVRAAIKRRRQALEQ